MASASSSSGAPRVICPGADAPLPPLDSRLATPETHEEVVGGVRIQTLPADPTHGDSHFDFSQVLGALLQPGYVGSIDMLTRYSAGDDFAADITIRRGGIDPGTEQRYLEELALEIGNSQRRGELERKAVRMSLRGVRRIFAIMVREQEAYEWDAASGKLVRLQGEAITDPPTLVSPLPVALLLLIARGAAGRVSPREVQAAVKDFVAEALVAQGNPAIRRAEQRAEQRSRAQALLMILEARGVAVDDVSRRRILGCEDRDALQGWLVRAATATRVEDVLS